jgi:hypothetical protein
MSKDILSGAVDGVGVAVAVAPDAMDSAGMVDVGAADTGIASAKLAIRPPNVRINKAKMAIQVLYRNEFTSVLLYIEMLLLIGKRN